MNEMVKIDMAQYGLDATKAAEVKKDFDAVLKIAVELEGDYNRVVALPIEQETCALAKALRLKYVKVRTGIAAVHKDRKAFYLSGGRAIDGLKNAYTHAVEGNEARLETIENHFVNLERERLAKLQEERGEALSAYEPDYVPADLGAMDEAVWTNYISGVEMAYKRRKEAEAQAEADRIAREKAEAEERERIRRENEKLKAEAAEADRLARIEADKRAKEDAARKADEAKKQAAHDAELKAERERREKIERDARNKAEGERKAKAEADRLASNRAHQAAIHNAAVASLVVVGLTEEQSKDVVRAIARGNVANVKLQY